MRRCDDCESSSFAAGPILFAARAFATVVAVAAAVTAAAADAVTATAAAATAAAATAAAAAEVNAAEVNADGARASLQPPSNSLPPGYEESNGYDELNVPCPARR